MKNTFLLLLLFFAFITCSEEAMAQSYGVRVEAPRALVRPSEEIISWTTRGEKLKKVELWLEDANRQKIEDLPLEGTKKLFFDGKNGYYIALRAGKQVFKRYGIQPRLIDTTEQALQVEKQVLVEGEELRYQWYQPYFRRCRLFLGDSVMIANELPNSYRNQLKLPAGAYTLRLECWNDDYPHHKLVSTVSVRVLREPSFSVEPVYLHSPLDSLNRPYVARWEVDSSLEVNLYRVNERLNYGYVRAGMPHNDTTRLASHLPAVGSIPLDTPSKHQVIYYMLETRIPSMQYAHYLYAKGEVVQTYKDTTKAWSFKVSINGQAVEKKANIEAFSGDVVRIEWQSKGYVRAAFFDPGWNAIEPKMPAKGRYTFIPTESGIYHFVFYDEEKKATGIPLLRVQKPLATGGVVKIEELPKQHRLHFQIIETDKSRYPEQISFKVVVTDSVGRFVSGLDAVPGKYFKKVIEEWQGKPAEYSILSVKEVEEDLLRPKVFVTVADYSGSMYGQPIIVQEQAIKAFIEAKLDADYLGFVQFDDRLRRTTHITQSRDTIAGTYRFAGLKEFGGNTALYAAIDEAVKMLEEMPGKDKYEKYIVLLTDGYENSSFAYWRTHAFDLKQLAIHAGKAGVKLLIFPIGEGVNFFTLSRLAELLDGLFFPVVNRYEQLKEVYRNVPRLLRRYYLVSFKPLRKDDWREFQLEVWNQVNTQRLRRSVATIPLDQLPKLDDFRAQEQEFVPSESKTAHLFNGKQVIVPPQVIVHFDYNSSKLLPQALPALDSYAEFMKKDPLVVAELYGYTDLKGDDEQQIKLSEQRAKAVFDYLVKKGIQAERIRYKGFGKAHPVWKEEKEPWQAAENRRVEIVLLR
ncbi:MAG: hypothetical protein KatS3mg033_0724 [Thermonema sp.]|uniref:OmpA family protein n=1 Tax=Thermonema sp. TaxID=2231181 RepID=UPI0021DCA0DB|nr:OmpA family protein [Thermonema sp.]GIV38924.1 MAG: hypothetical protein KatS3mg033_0724 [Thermonema sp.]